MGSFSGSVAPASSCPAVIVSGVSSALVSVTGPASRGASFTPVTSIFSTALAVPPCPSAMA
jgi:hypothetical protein